MLISTNEYNLALVGFCLFSTSMAQDFVNFTRYSSSFPSVFFLHLMTRYVSLFGSTVSFVSFTQRQWIPYQLISIYCVSVTTIGN